MASARPRCCTSSSAAADGDIRPGSTGTPVPGYRAAILDEDGAEVGDGQPGRLAVKGPTGCRYLSDPRQQTYVQHGWNITGDTYIRDADGYYWYQARSDDMIISAGYNIAGPEVEEALLGHPDVVEVAVVGAPDPDRGMIVQAYVVLRDPAAAAQDKAAQEKLQSCRSSPSSPSRRTSTRGWSSSSPNCPRPSAGRPSATACAS